MSALVSKVIGRWLGANGCLAEVVYEGSNVSGPERWAAVDSLPAPVVRLETQVELSDGSRRGLGVGGIAHLLPDHTGVLVVFVSAKPPAGLIFFDAPNNAAIFNADGSLRFQLKNPWGEHGSFRAVVSNPLPNGSFELGVRACPRSYPVCEDVYIVDGSTDDLSKQIPRWVRD
ncbi:hypothetical protein AB4Z46_11060 [Variovorax sp. M-6]|uniref:hypothetical protein n=1 Tax=Variovorax sp. M-6 TaxID=3233041 RepID=UPI003F99743A